MEESRACVLVQRTFPAALIALVRSPQCRVMLVVHDSQVPAHTACSEC